MPRLSHFEQVVKDAWPGFCLCCSVLCYSLQVGILSLAANAGSTAAMMRRLSHLGQIVEELAALGVTGLGTVDNTRLQGEVTCCGSDQMPRKTAALGVIGLAILPCRVRLQQRSCALKRTGNFDCTWLGTINKDMPAA